MGEASAWGPVDTYFPRLVFLDLEPFLELLPSLASSTLLASGFFAVRPRDESEDLSFPREPFALPANWITSR